MFFYLYLETWINTTMRKLFYKLRYSWPISIDNQEKSAIIVYKKFCIKITKMSE